MSPFTPPPLLGLKGGRKDIRHSTLFVDQVAFPGCSVYYKASENCFFFFYGLAYNLAARKVMYLSET